jgi:signal transduction histidine kinase
VDIRLGQEDGVIILEVRDNGRGIDEEQLSAGRSLGILGMRERACCSEVSSPLRALGERERL